MDGVRVLGGSGQAVLLLPGGAEATDGFFPGLQEGLVADPGCRVILHDRPGTGTSPLPGAFGAPLVPWPGAIHDLQLSHPDETLAVVRELVGGVAAGVRP